MELYQLRTFLMVAQEGHLTRAAQKLYTSQPAVSAQIKNLEEELGITLFLRNPKGMILTEEGRELLDHAKQAISIIDTMASRAGQLKGTLSGTLRLGMNSTAEFLRVPSLYSSLLTRHPDLTVHFLQSQTGELPDKLESGKVDCGFIFGESDNPKIHHRQLAQLRLVVVGSPSLKNALETAAPAELGHFPWITTPEDCPFHTVIERFFSRHNIQPQQLALADQESVIKSMIKAREGVCILLKDDVSAAEDLDFAIWDKEEMYLPLSICCLKRRKDETLLRTVFSILAGIWAAE